MQEQRSNLISFPKIVNPNQESLSNNTEMDHPSWDDVSSPAKSHLPPHAMNISGRDFGESSSSANTHDQNSGDGLKIETRWPLAYGVSVAEKRSEDYQEEPSNIHLHERVGSQINLGPLSTQISGSDGSSASASLTDGFSGKNDDRVLCVGPDTSPSLHKSPGSISSVGVGTSYRRSVEHDGSGSSHGNWGSSCKRKAIESISSQPYPAGSTGLVPDTVPSNSNASSSLRTLVHSVTSQTVNSPVGSIEQVNTTQGGGIGDQPSDAFPPLSVAGSAQNSSTDSGPRLNEDQERNQFNLTSVENSIRCTNARSSRNTSQSILSGSLDFRQTTSLPNNSSNASNHPHSRRGHSNMPVTWNRSLNSGTNVSSSSLSHPRHSGGLREEANWGSTIGNTSSSNNVEHPTYLPATETGNIVQDPTTWGMSTGSSSTLADGSSSGQANSGSLSHPSGRTRNRITLEESAALTNPLNAEPEAGESGEHDSPYPSEPSSPEETEMPSIGNVLTNPPPNSRNNLSREMRTLFADIGERQRLVSEIRQVLGAMRRGENLRDEDYRLFDQFMEGADPVLDRHRDMRLDVDNMSYEELLALEDRMGDVKTGLSEETISKLLMQRRYSYITILGPTKTEPCCICQEEYIKGEILGMLDCRHEFHTDCIKQWLLQKNVCPICKKTALRP